MNPKKAISIINLLLFCISMAQNPKKDIKALNGIWVAEDYYNAFEKTSSAVKSKHAFNSDYPVALRINSKEIKNGSLNIGYAVLHDHMLHPEVSEYLVKDKDTIREQGNFKINLKAKDSLGYYKTSDIYYFNYDWISYLSWNSNDNTVTLYRPKGHGHEERYITYKRLSNTFKKDYLYPNPLYYYTRSKILSGTYTLKDGEGNILSKSFSIGNNGSVKGYHLFNHFTAYFSTDIYCGPPQKYDFVLFIDDILIEGSKSFDFYYVKKENGNICLHERLYYEKRVLDEDNGPFQIGKKLYELVKN